MICNICGKMKTTHKHEELEVCDECQKLINIELKKPKIKDNI